jgi:hypothetical protein
VSDAEGAHYKRRKGTTEKCPTAFFSVLRSESSRAPCRTFDISTIVAEQASQASCNEQQRSRAVAAKVNCYCYCY